MLLTWLEVGRMFSSSSSSRQEGLLARDSTILSLNRPVPQHTHYAQPECLFLSRVCVCVWAWLVFAEQSAPCVGTDAVPLANCLCRTYGKLVWRCFLVHKDGERGKEGVKAGRGRGGGPRSPDQDSQAAACFCHITLFHVSSDDASRPSLGKQTVSWSTADLQDHQNSKCCKDHAWLCDVYTWADTLLS